jgi:hypothetical protein
MCYHAHLPACRSFYPPEPPPPGGESNLLAALQTVGWDAPADLAADVGEPFYPPLGSVLAEKALTNKQRTRLDEYRRRRQAALEALRAGLRQNPPVIPNQEEVLGRLEAGSLLDLSLFRRCAQFAREYPILAARRELGWGHYRV